ncbi:hypothetical protein [Aquibacillus sediminis]|uniref:hypothetical protein n=1 Tax=Aquibacillus sediminis TaxID=2574734 RepID=UPI001108FE18|nr:hypothetical protein [Aquibacillus sediminis]
MHVPTILSGPILRRVETSQIYIWIATSQQFDVNAELFQVKQSSAHESIYEPISIQTNTETMKLGKKLFIHLIKLTPNQNSFPINELLGYNLTFDNGRQTLDLESFGLLSVQNPHAIVYGDLKYPTFYINNSDCANIMYGSCRKPHSKGNDALVNADLVSEDHHTDLTKRPSALFLVGDQIYADDVADPLIRFIQDLSKELMGETEALEKLDSRLELDPFHTSLQQINGRQFIMRHFAKFTSTNPNNHLIQFGEYAVMYLLVLGPQLWDLAKAYGVFDPFEQRIKNNEYYFVYPDQPCFAKEREKEFEQYRNRYIDQLQRLHAFQQTLFHVRRALANTPTYMIFDDHDITDDWNLTAEWKRDVWNSPLGRHVVANGLAAYWAFQGWGNDPDRFSLGFKNSLSSYFEFWQIKSTNYQQMVNLLWDYDAWFFIAPTEPKAMFLDTRTMRQYIALPKPTTIGTFIKENVHSPKLISSNGWQRLSEHLMKSDWQSGHPLIVVSPTPLYGIDLIESSLHDYVYPLRTVGVSVETLLDFEAWKYNGEAFNEFHQWIAKWDPSHCFILSGDVHYASSATSTVEFPSGKQMDIYQFTSSPMNNTSFTGVWGFLIKQIARINSLKGETIDRYCDRPGNLVIENASNPCPSDFQWRETIQFLMTSSHANVITDNNIGLFTLDNNKVKNHLYKYVGMYQTEETFNTLSLK